MNHISGYRAKEINELQDTIRACQINTIIGGQIKRTPSGCTIIIDSGVSSAAPNPKPFDIKSITNNTITFGNCFYQWGRSLLGGGEMTYTASAGTYNIYAMLSDTLPCKIVNDPNDNEDGQLNPVALYRVTVTINSGVASVSILCDLRGSQVVIMS